MKKNLLTLLILLLLIITLCGCNKNGKITKQAWNKAFESLDSCSISYYGYRNNQTIQNSNLVKDHNTIHINSIHYIYHTQDNLLYYYTDTLATEQLASDDVYNLASLFNVIYYLADYDNYSYDASNNYYAYSTSSLAITVKFDSNNKVVSSLELNHIINSSVESNLNYDRFTFSY